MLSYLVLYLRWRKRSRQGQLSIEEHKMNIEMPWCAILLTTVRFTCPLVLLVENAQRMLEFFWDERKYNNIVLVQLRSFPQGLGESRSPMLMNAFWK